MIILADNDILLKLASCDLFDEFMVAFSVTLSDIRVLNTAHFSLIRTKHKKRIGDTGFNRLNEFLATVSVIDHEPELTVIAALTEQTDKNIDAGEANLFASCSEISDSVIVTGDKKSLVGLVEASKEDSMCDNLCKSLSNRVFCFEQVLIRILDSHGFNTLLQKLIEGRGCDTGLSLWLGHHLTPSEAEFREGLQSYLNDIRKRSGLLLAK